MGLFKQNGTTQLSDRETLENKYSNSLYNILLVVVLTIVNVFFLATNSGTYFLFSAYLPFWLVDLGMYLCGMYPAEAYGDLLLEVEFFPKSFFVITLVIAVVVIALYLISWFFARKQKGGWLIFALIFFSVDTLAMFLFNGFYVDMIIDYAMHAWVIVSLSIGVSSYLKLKNLPKEEPVPEAVEVLEEAKEEVSNEKENIE